MNILYSVKLFMFILLIFIILFQINKLITNIQTSDNYFIDLNGTLAAEINRKIKSFIIDNLKNKSPDFIFKNLKKNFPIIDFVNLERKNSDLLKIKIVEYKPVYRINDDFVFTKNGGFFSKDFFDQDLISKLNQIFTNEKNQFFLNFIKQIPIEIINEFIITWNNKNLIFLKNKTEPFTIKINNKNIITSKIINICKKLILEKQLKDKKQNFTLDLRFSDQLIVCSS